MQGLLKIKKKTDGVIKSEYLNYRYNLGQTEYLGKELYIQFNNEYYIIEEGFHSYNPQKVFANTKIHHSFYHITIETTKRCLDFFCFDDSQKTMRMLCTIPKGSTYYENKDGEIVSDAITIDDVEEVEIS